MSLADASGFDVAEFFTRQPRPDFARKSERLAANGGKPEDGALLISRQDKKPRRCVISLFRVCRAFQKTEAKDAPRSRAHKPRS